MSTSPRAETSATAAHCNAYQQRRLDNYDDLIDFAPQKYDNGYAFSTYQKDTGRSFTPMPIQYEICLDEEEEDDDYMVIMDPDDAPILPLHDDEYEERYLQQRANRTYVYRYQRPQINNPIIDPLEPETQPENNCFLQIPQIHFNNPSSPPQRYPPTLENPNNEELNELKKAISEMAQNMKTLIQKQNENKKPVTNPMPNSLQFIPTQPRSYQS
ncbi:9693_t:CDS:2, partial [Gigaspora margarita]